MQKNHKNNVPQVEISIPDDPCNLKLADPFIVNYYNDARERRYWIEGEVTAAITDIYKAILTANREDEGVPVGDRVPIKLYVNSVGGLLAETLALANLIKMSKTPIYTYNMCRAYSAAGLILMSGHKRFAMPSSYALIHSGTGGAEGTFEQAEEQMKHYKDLVQVMKDLILKNAKIDPKVLSRKLSTEWYLNTEDMLKYGLVDEVISDINSML
jgi:ATP-dependent Clp protease protease subunit